MMSYGPWRMLRALNLRSSRDSPVILAVVASQNLIDGFVGRSSPFRMDGKFFFRIEIDRMSRTNSCVGEMTDRSGSMRDVRWGVKRFVVADGIKKIELMRCN